MNVEYPYETSVFSDVLVPKIPKLTIKNLLGSKERNLSLLLDTGSITFDIFFQLLK